MGWDTADPALVTVECEVRNRKADYGLLDEQGEPLVFLEAKHLDEPLSKHLYQVANYANHVGIRYYALTNGDDWEVYDNDRNNLPIDERDILKLSLSREPMHQSALKLLLLWRANMASGSPQPAAEPIVGVTYTANPLPEQVNQVPPIVKETLNPQGAQHLSSTTMPGPGDVWKRLTEFEGESGTKPPPVMKFRNGDERSIRFWNAVLKEAAEHLILNYNLTASVCPIPAGPRARRYLVNVEPRMPDGRSFKTSHQLSNGLYLDTGFNIEATIRMSRFLLERLGQDPAQVWLKTS